MTRDREEVPQTGHRLPHRTPADRREDVAPGAGGPVRSSPQPVGVAALRQLQRSAGNAAVGRAMAVVQRGKFTGHAAERGKERGISNTRMREVIRTGKKYDDPNYPEATVFYEAATGWAVCTVGGQVLTTYNTASPKARWVPR